MNSIRSQKSSGFPAPVIDPNPHERISDATDRWLTQLAAQAQLGDRAARNAIYEALRPRFTPIFWRIRSSWIWREREGRSWLFEDLEQESFLIVCELIQDWKGGETGIVGYILSRLPWRLRDVLRRWIAAIKHEAPSLPIGLPADDVTDPAEIRVVLESVFGRLSHDLAEVLYLRAFDGLRDEEIALRLRVNVRTVRRRRHAGYRQARAIYLGDNPALK